MEGLFVMNNMLVVTSIYTCLINFPPKTSTIEASKPNTGFVNSAMMLISKSLVSLRELVLSTTLGFIESTEKEIRIDSHLELLRELIIGNARTDYSIP